MAGRSWARTHWWTGALLALCAGQNGWAQAPAAPAPAPAPTPSPLGCAEPILPPGQEEAVRRLFVPAVLPPGVVPGNIAILGDRIAGTWTWSPGRGAVQSRAYVLTPANAAVDPKALRAGRLVVQLGTPCWAHGAISRPTDKALSSLGIAAAASATCAETADAAAIDAALVRAVQEAEGALRWQCPTVGASAGNPQSSGLSALLRDIDDKSLVGDQDAVQGALTRAEQLAAQADLDLTGRFDLGLALALHGRKAAAEPVLRRAVADWAARLQDPAAVGRAERIQNSERAAAAHVLLGEIDQGRKVLADCWTALPEDPSGTGSCTALALADALVVAGHPRDAEAALDQQLKRVVKPLIPWFSARIGLASRQEDSRSELATVEAAVKTWPDDLSLRDALATACFRAGEHLRAVRELEQIFKKDPNFPGVLGRLSGVINDWGRVDPARPGQTSGWQTLRDEMKARAARDPADTVAQFVYGVSLFYDAQFEPALVQMKLVEPRAPNEGRVFIYQAMAHLWLGHPQEAQKLADKAVQANPRDPDVYYCQSQVLRQHDKAAAAKALERYLVLEMQPGALHFAKKTKRVESELALLRKGEMPPLWDKPGHYDDEDEPDRPGAGLPLAATASSAAGGGRSLNPPLSVWLMVGIAAVVFIGGGTWLTRRKK